MSYQRSFPEELSADEADALRWYVRDLRVRTGNLSSLFEGRRDPVMAALTRSVADDLRYLEDYLTLEAARQPEAAGGEPETPPPIAIDSSAGPSPLRRRNGSPTAALHHNRLARNSLR